MLALRDGISVLSHTPEYCGMFDDFGKCDTIMAFDFFMTGLFFGIVTCFMFRLVFGSPKKILKSSTEGFTFTSGSMKRWFEFQSFLIIILLAFIFQAVFPHRFWDVEIFVISFWLIISFLISSSINFCASGSFGSALNNLALRSYSFF